MVASRLQSLKQNIRPNGNFIPLGGIGNRYCKYRIPALNVIYPSGHKYNTGPPGFLRILQDYTVPLRILLRILQVF